MNHNEQFSWETAFKVADDFVFNKTNEHLKDIESYVFQGSWEARTYEEVARDSGYDYETIKKVGAKLWKKLSEALKEKVSKQNFKRALKRKWEEVSISSKQMSEIEVVTQNLSIDNQSQKEARRESPTGPVPLNSSFYIKRDPDEERSYNEIFQLGALIRIKGLKQTGKTSLISRMLAQAEKHGYKTVHFKFQKVDAADFTSLDKFLRRLCANISKGLNLDPQFHDWDEELFGSKQSCTMYFQTYLLEQIETPVVLALDDAHLVFQYPHISKEFFPLLREWYEEAKNLDIWQKLRVIVAYSTEVYIPLNINQSPFNVGLSVNLPEFTVEQVQALAQWHELDWNNHQAEQLTQVLGGHPYLIRLALDSIKYNNISLNGLLEDAYTEAGIYSDYLREHLETLQDNLELSDAFQNVITSDKPVKVETILLYKLQKMGLVQVKGNDVTPRCNLYREYFKGRLRVSI